MVKPKTRQATNAFGTIGDLPKNVLPTFGNVGQYFYSLRRQLSKNEAIDRVCTEVEQLWDKASIPTIATKSIEVKITRFINKGIALNRSKSTNRDTFSFDLPKLFDIACCHCADYPNPCTCPRTLKFDVEERLFLADQRGPREMFIGGEDKPRSAQVQKTLKRKRDCQV
jgi:hypothetical protein